MTFSETRIHVMGIVCVLVEAQYWDISHTRVGLWDLRLAVSVMRVVYPNLRNVSGFLMDNVLTMKSLCGQWMMLV